MDKISNKMEILTPAHLKAYYIMYRYIYPNRIMFNFITEFTSAEFKIRQNQKFFVQKHGCGGTNIIVLDLKFKYEFLISKSPCFRV